MVSSGRVTGNQQLGGKRCQDNQDNFSTIKKQLGEFAGSKRKVRGCEHAEGGQCQARGLSKKLWQRS